jgi:CRISPR-associated protein Cas1
MHVVEVSQATALIRLENGCLAISTLEGQSARVPIAEVGTLVLSSPHASCTVAALAALASTGTSVVVCDHRMRPAGMMLPFREHSEVASRIQKQTSAKDRLKQRLWKSLIQSKITGQAHVLAEMTESDHGLLRASKRVRVGDPDNTEARAARRYWGKLFGPDFRRRRGTDMPNKMLDYGYAILRSAVVRGICVAGLHPSIGIHHHNRANAFALADDLIEPFRPAVDLIVARITQGSATIEALTPSLKRSLVACLESPITFEGKQRSVRDAIGHTCSSLAGVFLGEREELSLPWIG